MSKVLALSGFKGSGKDTVAEYLVKKYGFERISFADPLKNMVAENFHIARESLDNPDTKESPILAYPVPAADKFTEMVSTFMVREFRTASGFPPDVKYIKIEKGILQTFTDKWENLYHTPRSLAILMGSSMRSGSSSFWVQKAIDAIKYDSAPGEYKAAISDLRYKSEVNQLRNAFGENLVTVRINRFDTSPSTDPSELDLVDAKFDIVLVNKGTKEELFEKVDDFMRSLK